VYADTFILMSGPTGIFTFSASGFAPPLLQKAEASKSGALNPEPLPCRDSDLSLERRLYPIDVAVSPTS